MKQSRRFAVPGADFRFVSRFMAVRAKLRLATRQCYRCGVAIDGQTFWLMKAVTVSAVVAKFVKQCQCTVDLHRGGMTLQALSGCTRSLGTAGVIGDSVLETVAVAAGNRQVRMVQVVDRDAVTEAGAKEQQHCQHDENC